MLALGFALRVRPSPGDDVLIAVAFRCHQPKKSGTLPFGMTGARSRDHGVREAARRGIA